VLSFSTWPGIRVRENQRFHVIAISSNRKRWAHGSEAVNIEAPTSLGDWDII
jgi:hypothetical protein